MVFLTYKLDNANVPKKFIAPWFSIKKFFQEKKKKNPSSSFHYVHVVTKIFFIGIFILDRYFR